MNKRIGVGASLLNMAAVAGFAASMPFGFDFGSYLSSCFISLSFVAMMCAFTWYAAGERKVAGLCSVGFAAVYCALILLVYFSQLTTVRLTSLTAQATDLLDFSRFGLMFNYDLLGYALMSLSTFFAGLTIVPQNRPQKALKVLLLVHGVFFLSCFFMPMLGLFQPDMAGGKWTGVLVLEVWCAYFLPVSWLSYRFFQSKA